jgi:hypothetical protein
VNGQSSVFGHAAHQIVAFGTVTRIINSIPNKSTAIWYDG